MRRNFPYPIPATALDEFRHPAAGHVLNPAVRYAGDILAGNGYVAVRARRGRWIDEEYPPASSEYLARFEKLPWNRFQSLQDDWRLLDDQSGRIFGRGQIGFWLEVKTGWTVNASPVWRVNDSVLVRLSLLQLLARLPRCEAYTGAQDCEEPLFFRFSGGIGIVARDKRLTLSSGNLFPPARDCFTGARMRKKTVPKYLPPINPNWPPADMSEG